jgi:hypothetical protein
VKPLIRHLMPAVAGCAVFASFGPAAQILDPTAAAVFAGSGLTFGGSTTVTGGPVLSNDSVFHAGGSLNLTSIYAGGSFNAGSAAFQNSTGEWLFNGSINNLGGPGSVIAGPVTSALGNVITRSSSQTINGNVTAFGDARQLGGTINGTLRGGGNVNVSGTVNGNVVYGGAYSTGPFGAVTGTVTAGGPVSPTTYVPLTLPAGSGLAANTNDITLTTFETRTLTPGVYGDLTFASSNTVNLSAGTYVFSGLFNANSLNPLSFNTSAGPIKIYVAGDLDFNFSQAVNGLALNSASALDSQKISFEAAGSIIAESDVFGRLFAPNGDITLSTFADVTGPVLAGGNVVMLGSNSVTLVPEPTAVAMIGAAGLMALRRRRSR